MAAATSRLAASSTVVGRGMPAMQECQENSSELPSTRTRRSVRSLACMPFGISKWRMPQPSFCFAIRVALDQRAAKRVGIAGQRLVARRAIDHRAHGGFRHADGRVGHSAERDGNGVAHEDAVPFVDELVRLMLTNRRFT